MRKLLIFILLAILLTAAGIFFTFFPKMDTHLTRLINVSTQSANLKISEKKDFSQLSQSYNQILSQTSADFSITFLDLKTGEKVSIAGEKTFHAASATKPVVAVYALKQIDEGKIDFNQKIGELPLPERLRLMINVSDNNSWEQLLKFFGISKLQNFSQGLGLTNTSLFKNTSTTEDLANFLVKIYRNEILSGESKESLLTWMQNTETEDRIPKGVENKKLVFHKAGSFAGGIHDIGIIAHDKNPFVLAILSDGMNDLDKRPKILAEIAKASWEFADSQ